MSPEANVFLNLSNHPSHTWPPEQRAAAEELGGTIRDVSFPSVPPEYDTDDVEAMAATLVRRLPSETRAALVAGEPSLTAALVRRLRAAGVRCLVATSSRGARPAPVPRSGTPFRFVRFREWPALG